MGRARRWTVVGLALYGTVVAAVLTLPLGYSGVGASIRETLERIFGVLPFGTGWIEFTANIAMFLPLGLLLALLVGRPGVGFAIGVSISVAAEVVQILIPGRTVSMRDILANAVGAAAGAGIAWVMLLRRRAHPTE